MKTVGGSGAAKAAGIGGSLIRGVSPTVTLTGTDEGTEITIKDIDGPHTALVRNGTDYILTEQDKAEIVEMALEALKNTP